MSDFSFLTYKMEWQHSPMMTVWIKWEVISQLPELSTNGPTGITSWPSHQPCDIWLLHLQMREWSSESVSHVYKPTELVHGRPGFKQPKAVGLAFLSAEAIQPRAGQFHFLARSSRSHTGGRGHVIHPILAKCCRRNMNKAKLKQELGTRSLPLLTRKEGQRDPPRAKRALACTA